MKNICYMLLLGWICCISGCRCGDCEDPTNPDCKNYDPCHSSSSIKADFNIIETSFVDTPYWKEIDTDTFRVSWKCKAIYTNGIKHTWIIGTDSFSESTVSLWGLPLNTRVPVKHIVEATNLWNDKCHAKDTLERYLYQTEQSKVHGTFRGSFSDKPDSIFDVTILTRPPFIIYGQEESRFGFQCVMKGLGVLGCEYYLSLGLTVSEIGYKQIAFTFYPHQKDTETYSTYLQRCENKGILGNAYLNTLTNSITISYNYTNSSKKYTFVGTKI